ncbi:hypothetical protein GQ43DRAFT_363718, partial [Delitschia confertaspora ATCC 74209]
QSVTQYIRRLFDCLLPNVREELSPSVTRIHVSFDRWTIISGKKFGISLSKVGFFVLNNSGANNKAVG